MTLSVILTSYNYAHYLPQALDAITAQSFQPMELLIYDDASTDNSVEIIRSYQDKYSYITLHQNRENRGLFKNTLQAVARAQGDYVITCAADDEVLPGFFEKSISLLEEYPEAGLCASKYFVFNDVNPDQVMQLGSTLVNKACMLSPSHFIQRMQRKDARIGGQHTVFRRKFLVETDVLYAELGPLADWFIICVLALRHGICFIPEMLTKLRYHNAAYTNQMLQHDFSHKKAFCLVDQALRDEKYCDVRQRFIRSGLVHQIGLNILPEVIKHPRYVNASFAWHMGRAFLKHVKQRLIH